MSGPESPPLIEAIFELRWGERNLGEFSYGQEERSLLAGKLSAIAAGNGYAHIEMPNKNESMPFGLPHVISHRFRSKANDWPCYQVGLGIFTVNQVKEGYSWVSFLDAIQSGLSMLDEALPEGLASIGDSCHLLLRYQDAFFSTSKPSLSDYLSEHFHIEASLPDSFWKAPQMQHETVKMSFAFTLQTDEPKGNIDVNVNNAVIKGKVGLLMDTLVQSEASEVAPVFDSKSIVDWVGEAHILQKHAYKTLIKPSGEC